MRDDAGMSWTAIGKRLGINSGSAQKVNNFNTTLIDIATISTWLWQDLQKSKGVWYPIKSPANWLPSIFGDAVKQRFVDLLTRDARTRRLAWEAICMEMEMELGEIWGRVGDIEVLEACLKAAWGPIPQERMIA